jgi:hypothetical protein
MRKILITLSDDDEYRVPGPKGTEAQAYYTNDRQDAILTAREMHKITPDARDVVIRIKRVRG